MVIVTRFLSTRLVHDPSSACSTVLLLYLSSIQPVAITRIIRSSLLVRVLHVLITNKPRRTRLTHRVAQLAICSLLPFLTLSITRIKGPGKVYQAKTDTRTARNPTHPLSIRQAVAPVALWHGVHHCTVLCVRYPLMRR